MLVDVKHVCAQSARWVLDRAPVSALFVEDIFLWVDILQVPLEVVTFEVLSQLLSVADVTNISRLQKETQN